MWLEEIFILNRKTNCYECGENHSEALSDLNFDDLFYICFRLYIIAIIISVFESNCFGYLILLPFKSIKFIFYLIIRILGKSRNEKTYLSKSSTKFKIETNLSISSSRRKHRAQAYQTFKK